MIVDPLSVSVGKFVAATAAMGPGKRACLWVRGCSINCPGCITQSYIPEGRPEHAVPVEEICGWIDRAIAEHGITGMSFSGGEPFEQATALAHVAAHARDRGLSTLAWSGHTRRVLEVTTVAPPGSANFFRTLDVLIDGPFVDRFAHGPALPLRGSSNQRVHLLTERHQPEEFDRAMFEVELQPDGSIEMTGVTDYAYAEALVQILRSSFPVV